MYRIDNAPILAIRIRNQSQLLICIHRKIIKINKQYSNRIIVDLLQTNVHRKTTIQIIILRIVIPLYEQTNVCFKIQVPMVVIEYSTQFKDHKHKT